MTIRFCSSCGARVFWVTTPANRKMPLDSASGRWLKLGEGTDSGVCSSTGGVLRGTWADKEAADELDGVVRQVGGLGGKFVVKRGVYVYVYTSHFATCANAAQHRRRT